MKTSITHVAMDTHKKQHQVAWVHPDTGEIQEFPVANTTREIERMVQKIRRQAVGEMHVCYEAGVCGFVLQRLLEKLGCVCRVIAPSLVPSKPGDRVKTDRRDAKKLLGLFAAGQLTAVHPPDATAGSGSGADPLPRMHQIDLKRSRQRLNSLLVRHGYVYSGSLWTRRHAEWLQGLAFDQPRLRTVFDRVSQRDGAWRGAAGVVGSAARAVGGERAVSGGGSGVAVFAGDRHAHGPHAADGIYCFGRFSSPRALMAYLGVTPSEHSSGESRRTGGITKTGNRRVRRLLTESGWHYRHPPRVSKALQARRANQPAWAIDLADRAALRLYRRYKHLTERGKPLPQAVMAVVRELAGFIWAMLHRLPSCAAPVSP